ncbi:hypothetical protein CIK05_05365 [Bdellovibrio sp. qaytius]|nr:hypothetical protein CIK05_05365 [Bdellovibrio sp. qaytius]
MKVFLFVFLISTNVFAEYRVFTLMITNSKTGENKQFDSTLDPEQYQTFYSLKADETISYTQTWRCKGRTSDFKPHCMQPAKREPTQAAVTPTQAPATPPAQ